jgi:hypothetical protein
MRLESKVQLSCIKGTTKVIDIGARQYSCNEKQQSSFSKQGTTIKPPVGSPAVTVMSDSLRKCRYKFKEKEPSMVVAIQDIPQKDMDKFMLSSTVTAEEAAELINLLVKYEVSNMLILLRTNMLIEQGKLWGKVLPLLSTKDEQKMLNVVSHPLSIEEFAGQDMTIEDVKTRPFAILKEPEWTTEPVKKTKWWQR